LLLFVAIFIFFVGSILVAACSPASSSSQPENTPKPTLTLAEKVEQEPTQPVTAKVELSPTSEATSTPEATEPQS
jgi:hypothetical protein